MARSTAAMAKRRRRSVRRRRPPPSEGGGGGGGGVVEHGRDWSCLPDTALFSISQKAASFIHYYAFAGTCRTWRTVAMAALPEFMSSQPPLLCRSDGSLIYGPLEGRSYRNRLLDALLKPTLIIEDICHGYLVLDERDHRLPPLRREIKLRLFNPFSGDKLAPSVPSVAGTYLHWVLLTAPPRSPDCTVVASIRERLSSENAFSQTLVYCRPGDSCWRFRRSREMECFIRRPVASPDGRRLYTWNSFSHITIFELSGGAAGAGDLQLREVACVKGVESPLPRRWFSSALVLMGVSGAGELLCVEDTNFMYDDRMNRTVPTAMTGTAALFRLDEPRRRWVRVESLGGGALLLTRTQCVVSDDPARWGGKKDHVYIATPEGTLMVFPFCGRGNSVPASSVTSLPLPPRKNFPVSTWLLPGLSCR